jgi:hypothetical protein
MVSMQCVQHTTLSSNARKVPFEYPQIYLNNKGKVCKARVNEWIINQIQLLRKRIKEVSNAGVGRLFLKVQLPF